MFKYSLSMVVPAYNEEELLEEFIRGSMKELAEHSRDFEIVLVNDGSTDRTLDIARRMVSEFPNLKIIDLEMNLGTGKSILPGFAAASKEIIFTNTVDTFFRLADLPLMLKYLDDYDVVSGYRSDLSANTLYQKILTLGNYWLIRILFNINLRAYQTAQFYRTDFLQSIDIEARSSFIAPELLYKAIRKGKTIKEVEIRYYARKAGRAKGGSPRNIVNTAKDVLKLWFSWVILRRLK